jgi:hypothetical protein
MSKSSGQYSEFYCFSGYFAKQNKTKIKDIVSPSVRQNSAKVSPKKMKKIKNFYPLPQNNLSKSAHQKIPQFSTNQRNTSQL